MLNFAGQKWPCDITRTYRYLALSISNIIQKKENSDYYL